MHWRAAIDMCCTSCLWEVFTVLYDATAMKICSNVMNRGSDSENVGRLWHGGPQPSEGANSTGCLWFFILLMSLHDFPSEHVITVAPVLTMCDTRFLSVPVVNLCLLKIHVSASVFSVAAEHLRWMASEFRNTSGNTHSWSATSTRGVPSVPLFCLAWCCTVFTARAFA